MKMYMWRHLLSGCLFVQVGARTYGAKMEDQEWSELKEDVFPAVFLQGIDGGVHLQGSLPSPQDARGLMFMGGF